MELLNGTTEWNYRMELLVARIVCAFIFLVVQIVNAIAVGLMIWAAIYIPIGIFKLYQA